MTCSDFVAEIERSGFVFDLTPDGEQFFVRPRVDQKTRDRIAARRDEIVEYLNHRRDRSYWSMLHQVANLFPGAKVEQADAALDAWMHENMPDATETQRRSLDLIARARLVELSKSDQGAYDQTVLEMFETYDTERRTA